MFHAEILCAEKDRVGLGMRGMLRLLEKAASN
jgi:hypothetical protein